jgi:twinkle protein
LGKQIKIHLPCSDCGSSDALSEYEGEDGSTYSVCYSCNTKKNLTKGTNVTISVPTSIVENGKAVPDKGLRSITKKSLDYYGIRVQDDNHIYPYYDAKTGRELLVQKLRTKAKSFPQIKKHDNATQEIGLFGQHLFSPGQEKTITVCEGELEPPSFRDMMGEYPCVAMPGASTKLTQEQKDYLDSYDTIVVVGDNDKAGDSLVESLAGVFPKKIRVFKHPFTEEKIDPNWYLANGHREVFAKAWWAATRTPYKPDSIKVGAETLDIFMQDLTKSSLSYPWAGLNEITYGIRPSELVLITAGSGVGKSAVLRSMAYHIWENTSAKIGMIFLEESLRRTVKGIGGIHMGKNIVLPDIDAAVDKESKRQAWSEVLDNDRWVFWDHFGSNNVDKVLNQIRFMATQLDCRIFFLDHISIIVSAQDNGDERKTLDSIMTKLATLCQELDVAIIAVSHLRRPNAGQSHEEGANVKLSDLRGSAGLGQLSDIVIGLERNGQALDPRERNTTTLRIIKNRFSGETGPCCKLLWEKESGLLTEIPLIDNNDNDEFKDLDKK